MDMLWCLQSIRATEQKEELRVTQKHFGVVLHFACCDNTKRRLERVFGKLRVDLSSPGVIELEGMSGHDGASDSKDLFICHCHRFSG